MSLNGGPKDACRSYSIRIELTGGFCDGKRQVARKILNPGVSAGCFVQQCLERQSQWLARVVQTIPEIQEKTSDCCLVQCGAGCDILVLLNDAKFPVDVSRVPKIGVGLARSFGTVGRSSSSRLHAARAWICPRDSVFVFMEMAAQNGDDDHFFLEIDGSPRHSYQQAGDKRVLRIQLTGDTGAFNVSSVQREEYESRQFDLPTTVSCQ